MIGFFGDKTIARIIFFGALALFYLRAEAAFADQSTSALAGKPVAAQDADGNLEVFKVDPDGQVRHRWRKTANGDWSNWASLGGAFDPGLAVVRDTEGDLEVLAVDHSTHALKCARQSSPDGPFWSGWTNLGGSVRAPVVVTTNAGGQIAAFACAVDSSAVRYIHQLPGGLWSRWTDLGGDVEPQLAAALNSDGRMEVFGIAPITGHLLHCWQLQPTLESQWSLWADLGGQMAPELGVGRNRDGRLEVFGVNPSQSAVERIYQITAGESIRWTGWSNFYGANVLSGVVVSSSGDGRLEAFAVNAKDSTLWHCWQMKPDGSDVWSGWWGLGWPVQSTPSAVCDNDGNLEVFAIERNHPGVLDYKRQISASSDWLDWEPMDRPSFAYTTRTWQMDEGLPNNTVQAITQTADGFLWVGTLAGLARFDGVSFLSYDPRNTPELKNPSVTTLCADRDGSLWIGTDGGGLLRFRDGNFTRWSTTNGLVCDALRVVYQTRDGALWIGTTNGMNHYFDGRWTAYTTSDGLLSDWVQSIYEDRDRALWIGTGRGLNRLKDGKMDSFLMPKGIPNDAVRAICQDKGGRTWIASNNGMLWYDWYFAGHFYAYNTRYGLSDSFVSALCEDRERNFWVGTFSGLNRFRDGRFYPQLTQDGLPFDRVNALFEGREGDLWVGTKEGLVRLTPKRFAVYTKEQGLTHNNVTSVMEDREGNLWLGTWGGGVDEMVGERVRALATTNGLSDDLILATCQTRDGSIWIGADFDGGLTRLKDGQLTHYGPNEGLISAGIRVLHEDRHGVLWIGTRRGLVNFSNGKFTTYTTKDNLAGNAVRAICEDRTGALWFGTETGLSRLDQGKFVNFNSHNGLSDDTVLALSEDNAGNLWIGTQAGGLDRCRDGRFTSYTSRHGLFSDEIFSIVEDDFGWLWMSCSKGIFRVRKDDFDAFDKGLKDSLVSIAYGKTDGMQSPQCNGLAQPASCKTQDGRLCFPTSKGLVVVNPRTVRVDQVSPPVVIEEVMADKEPVRRGRRPGQPIENDAVLRLRPGRGELEFHFTALSFLMPERCQFKYKLDGVDPEWVEAGNQRAAYYNNIYPGEYRFEVMACNQDGVWSRNEAAVTVIMVPHVWQTLWFRALAGVVVLGSIFGLARFLAIRRMRRKVDLLEHHHAIEKERNRIAKDIHDDLGSSLTRIMMLGERTEEGLIRREDVSLHIRKIVDSARDTVQSLDEIVWAVNPENDTLDGLANYISHYADEFFEDTSISCRLEMPMKLPSTSLKAEVRHDLFLAVKEAFHNSLKHSGASAVRVCVSSRRDAVTICVEDNGRGFSQNGNSSRRRGNGLENMRRRIESLSGQFSIVSAPNQGTQITFSVQLNASVGHPASGR